MPFLSFLPAPIRRNLAILLGSSLLFWCSLSSLLPIIPLYAESLGGTPQQIGWITGAFAVGLITARPWLGQLADQRSRKLVLLIGMGVAAIAPLGYLLAPSPNWLMLFRALHGISISAFATAYLTLVADFSPVQYRGTILGYMTLGNPLGTAIGPAIGGLLLAHSSFAFVFMMAAGFGLAGFLSSSQVEPPPLPAISEADRGKPFWYSFDRAGLAIPTLAMLLVGMAFGVLHTFIALFIKSLEIDLNPGIFYTAAAMGSFCVRILVGRIADRWGRGLFFTLSLSCYTLSMLLLSLAQNSFHFLLGGLVEGMSMGILIPIVSALIADRSYPQERGRLFGFCITGLDLGIAFAGPIFGFLGAWLSYRQMFSIATVLPGLAIVLFMTQGGKNLLNSLQFAIGWGKDAYALPDQE
uniref:Major facilitator superfamily MFS_1 n=1 Tax=Cyanothece sp. (strain PCC 7425 / ATCC 29141) TaxID=395961 RepID=B8HL77_CYAP4